MKKTDLSSMKARWPSAIVARQQIGYFTGGIITPAYIAGLDANEKGPPRIKIGKKVAYPVDSLISWLEGRCEIEEE